MELCDYTLDEYVNIVRLDHQQDPLSANRLAWQLLKGLKYLHSNFAVPHGNLMVSSIDYGYQNVRVRKLVDICNIYTYNLYKEFYLHLSYLNNSTLKKKILFNDESQ